MKKYVIALALVATLSACEFSAKSTCTTTRTDVPVLRAKKSHLKVTLYGADGRVARQWFTDQKEVNGEYTNYRSFDDIHGRHIEVSGTVVIEPAQ